MCKQYRLILSVLIGIAIWSSRVWAEDALRDPTQPPTYPNNNLVTTSSLTSQNSDIKITAIVVDKNNKNRNVVMIGGNAFTIGDKISGLTITAIDTDCITLKNEDGNETRVNMPYFAIKQPITNN